MALELKSEVHYNANILIEKVMRTPSTNPMAAEKREMTEVVRLNLKSEDLNMLIDKLGQHLELVEEM